MEFAAIETLRERHAAWRLLRAGNAPLILSFLGSYFVDANRGASPASIVAAALDDVLYQRNLPDADTPRYPRAPIDYLEDWAAIEAGYLRRFYPEGSDEVHFDVTPAFERAYGWVSSLGERSFVGTESRLHIVVELLRQIVHGTETDPQARLAELQRRRAEIDAEIEAVQAGDLHMLDSAGVRDRYQQFAATARELLSDFRQVEENFRHLDRAAREKIATWTGAKGELLAELVGTQSEISSSDQGRSFQAFYEYLLSQRRQDELADLLSAASHLPDIDPDPRMRSIRDHWSEAAERTQLTVRQISEQLRRFLDDQVWLENRRVVDVVRAIETAALTLRDQQPTAGLTIDLPGIEIALPMERPLYHRSETPLVADTVSDADAAPDPELLFAQSYIDYARLADNIRSVIPHRATADLTDIVALFPVQQGAAEILGYLALGADDIDVTLDDDEPTSIDYAADAEDVINRRLNLPRVTVRRR